jgi:dTDP-glucose pyrophosphorylase
MKDINNILVQIDIPIRQAVETMDKYGLGFIACVDKEFNVKGVLTDGDFRRAILKGVQLDQTVSDICNKKFISLGENYTFEQVDKLFKEKPIKFIPIISDGKIIDIIFFEKYNQRRRLKPQVSLDNPVVIMAGGNGTRLDPFTKVFPKPLLPVSDKTIIEVIIDKFVNYKIKDFYVSVFYKKELIKTYFKDRNPDYNISYIEEDKPLGTAGCLYKLCSVFNKPFFVSNCDIIIDDNYNDIYNYHKEKENAVTIVSSLQHHTIPYGICEVDNDGFLTNINEKPQMDFLVNTGFYLLNPECLEYIPKNTFFDMTDLIQALMKDNKKVGVYPVSDQKWVDIGLLDGYRKMLGLA